MGTCNRKVSWIYLIMVLAAGIFLQCKDNITGSDALAERMEHSFSPGSGGFYYNSPTLVDNFIYIGTSRRLHSAPATDNFFFKLDLQLQKVWSFSLGAREVRGAATVDDHGNVYFVVEEGRKNGDSSESTFALYALDKAGKFKWSQPIMTPPFVPEVGMCNPALASDGTIYVGGDKFYAVDADGNEQWTYGDGVYIMNAPIIDPEGNIYFNSNGAVISLDPNGTERWRFSASGECSASPAFATDYHTIFVPVDQTLYRLEAATGNKVWAFTPEGVSGVFRATPAVDEENNIYLGTKANKESVFYAIKADGSGLLWKNPVGADLYSSPALGADHILYVGSEWSTEKQIHLHALNMQTGAAVWTASLAADVTWSSPALADNGLLYIGNMAGDEAGGTLYCLRTDSPGLMSTAGSSRFHEGNTSTGRRE